jgi:hypothetical protein
MVGQRRGRGVRTALGVAATTAVATVMLGAPAGAAGPVPAEGSGYTGGFATTAVATPLRVEIYEPAIPIPAEPNAELNFSYTKVTGLSGPGGTARSSVLWPGDAVGEGLKTIVEQGGLPPQLGANGYPVQVNAQYPGDTSHAEQEPLPGSVERVRVSGTGAVARAGYSSDGKVAGDATDGGSGGGSGVPGAPGLPALPCLSGPSSLSGLAGGGTTASNPLTALSQGDLSALGSALTGSAGTTADAPSAGDTGDSGGTDGSDADPAPSSPLGALGAVIGVDGMSSSSRTDYSGPDSVSATAAASLGEIRLAGGIVTLSGVSASALTSATADGSKATPSVSYGQLSIAGTPFALTPDGIVAAGNKTAIPGLPDSAAKALAMLGISNELPKPEKSVKGAVATLTASGPKITFDTGVLKSKLPSLPLEQITKNMPDSAGQLKSLLLALGEAHPKFVIYLGKVTSSAQTVKGITFPTGGGDTSATGTTPAQSAGGGASSSGSGSVPTGGTGAGVSPGSSGPVASSAPTASTPVENVSSVPGLPPLGSVPGMLTLGGLALAAGAGWWFRRGMGVLFGGAGTCPHGLASGLPDLRKV